MHKSFLYKREKAVGEKVYWTCRDHTLHGCRSRAITQGQRVTVMRNHCHPPDMEGLQARRQQETMKTPQARPGGPGGQVDKLLQGVGGLLYCRGPGTTTLTRPRPKKHTKPQAPQGSPTEDQDKGLGESSLSTDQSQGPLKSYFLRAWEAGRGGIRPGSAFSDHLPHFS